MQLRYKFELRCQLDRLRHSLDSAKILFRLGVGGKIIPRIRLTSAKDLVEVEAELGNLIFSLTLIIPGNFQNNLSRGGGRNYHLP